MKTKICDKGNIHLIGVPIKWRSKISNCVVRTLNNALKLLKYKKRVDIVVIESQSFFVIPKLGIGGTAIGKSCIEIRIDFSRKDLAKIIKIELPATIYHELSHIVRENSIGYGSTLLDSFISEGISCYVEKKAMPGKKIPYIQNIKEEKKFWHRAKKMFAKTKYNYSEWFFGTGKLPNWIGYRFGYLIVERFMNKHNIGLDKLIKMNSQNILDKSGLTQKDL